MVTLRHALAEEPERRHGEGRGDGRLRQASRRPLVEEARDRRADPALPRRGARLLRGDAVRDGDAPTTCSRTAGSRSSRSRSCSVADDKDRVARAAPRAGRPSACVHEESAFLVTDMLRSVINEGTAASARGARLHRRRRRQDGDHERLPRRLVRRLHARPPRASSGWASTTTRRSASPGTQAALPIWVDFMKAAARRAQAAARSRPRPRASSTSTIDKDTGLLAGPRCPEHAHRGVRGRHRAARGLRRSTAAEPNQPAHSGLVAGG